MAQDYTSFIRDDWFGPAVIESGSVGHCLGAVETLLNERLLLVRQINNALVPKENGSLDSLTLFGRKIAPLEQTILSRIEILRPENVQSWFRVPAACAKGPFQSEQLSLSVFGKFSLQDIDQVKRSIRESWIRKDLGSLFFEKSGNLWSELIKVRAEFYKVITLDENDPDLTLLNLPEEIKPELLTSSLKAFLRNVRAEVLSLNKRLENLFEILWASSDKFWEYQKNNKENFKAKRSYQEDASRVRDAFRKRREKVTASKPLSKEQAALSLMGFSTLPSMDDLKRKYRELARKFHPDAGGDEVKFKQLTESYALLSHKISNQVEFMF